MKIAIVCDWLLGTGGAERVVLELHKMFPKAPIYTSQYNPDPNIWYGDKWFTDADVRTGWLQTLPKRLKKFLPVFRAWYFSRLDLSDYDLVISSSGAEAKFVKVKSGSTHITYCHAPTHYYWSRYDEYLKNPGFGFFDPLARLGLRILAGPMRLWDFKAAQRPDFFIANSTYIKNQVKKYYSRESKVVHPPVDTQRFANHIKPESDRHGLVAAGRQTPYKRIDLAVEAAEMTDVALTVIGNGPDNRRLRRLARRKTTFLMNVSDEQMPEKLGQAKAFILPNADDFGIVAVEALAAGTPVVAYKNGGQLDYINTDNGVFFEEQNVESLSQAIQKTLSKNFSHSKIASTTKQFSPEAFKSSIAKLIKTMTNNSVNISK